MGQGQGGYAMWTTLLQDSDEDRSRARCSTNYVDVSKGHRSQLEGTPNGDYSDNLSIKIDDDSKEL